MLNDLPVNRNRPTLGRSASLPNLRQGIRPLEAPSTSPLRQTGLQPGTSVAHQLTSPETLHDVGQSSLASEPSALRDSAERVRRVPLNLLQEIQARAPQPNAGLQPIDLPPPGFNARSLAPGAYTLLRNHATGNDGINTPELQDQNRTQAIQRLEGIYQRLGPLPPQLRGLTGKALLERCLDHMRTSEVTINLEPQRFFNPGETAMRTSTDYQSSWTQPNLRASTRAGASGNPEYRRDTEALLTQNAYLTPDEKPLYAILNVCGYDQGGAPEYGKSWMSFAPQGILERSTLTHRDSHNLLANDHVAPDDFSQMVATAGQLERVVQNMPEPLLEKTLQKSLGLPVSPKKIVGEGKNGLPKPGSEEGSFVEVQVFGGLNFNRDLRELHIDTAPIYNQGYKSDTSKMISNLLLFADHNQLLAGSDFTQVGVDRKGNGIYQNGRLFVHSDTPPTGLQWDPSFQREMAEE
ncbi:MAG: hypothetical protein ACO1RX_18960 [Candidatus Sericytochromatia bacterium]